MKPIGAVTLDRENPWKVRYRCKPYVFMPEALYELTGDTPNVVFSCASLADSATGRIVIYYGAADTVVSLAFCKVDEVINFIKKNAEK